MAELGPTWLRVTEDRGSKGGAGAGREELLRAVG